MMPSPLADRLGFYPLVGSAQEVALLASLGVGCIQLRLKDQSPQRVRDEIRRAVEIQHECDLALYINDDAESACHWGAYGVHLGQEDLDHCLDSGLVDQVKSNGLRLGISCHNRAEVLRALAVEPSYLAYGPVFATRSKSLSYEPVGIEGIGAVARQVSCPVVAIGGLRVSHVAALRQVSVSGFAVISGLGQAEQWPDTIRSWQEAIRASES
jgi:thiamine-phosphate diphosphorylase